VPSAKPVVGSDEVEKVRELAAAVAKAKDGLKRAERDRDAAAVEKCISTLWHTRRQGGHVLAQMDGRIRPHPVDLEERKVWRRMTRGSAVKFEKRLARYVKKALGTLGISTATAKAAPAAKAQKKAHPKAHHSELLDQIS